MMMMANRKDFYAQIFLISSSAFTQPPWNWHCCLPFDAPGGLFITATEVHTGEQGGQRPPNWRWLIQTFVQRKHFATLIAPPANEATCFCAPPSSSCIDTTTAAAAVPVLLIKKVDWLVGLLIVVYPRRRRLISLALVDIGARKEHKCTAAAHHLLWPSSWP